MLNFRSADMPAPTTNILIDNFAKAFPFKETQDCTAGSERYRANGKKKLTYSYHVIPDAM